MATKSRDAFYLLAGDARVSLISGSMLGCSAHPGADWCDHISYIVTNNLDSQFWETEPPVEGETLSVPLIPSSDVWATVLFDDYNETLGASKVYLRLYKDDNESKDSLPFLGFFAPGEGRAVLRQMVYDWLRMEIQSRKVHKVKLECENKRHSYKQELAWQEALKSETNSLVEIWHVIDSGSCSACTEKNNDLDDLIPDPGTRPGRSPF